MFSKLSKRLTYANIVSSLALFLVLSGGTAVALTGSNTVFSDDIVDGEVKGADVLESSLEGVVKNCAPGSVRGLFRGGGSSMSSSYAAVTTAGNFACEGAISARRVSTGVYLVCFANMPTVNTKALATPATAGHHTSAIQGGNEQCATSNPRIDTVVRVTLRKTDGTSVDGTFSLLVP